MDWASRAVLAWRLSNMMDASFCVAALEEALARFGKPEIFNTDQGSQFTSAAFTGTLAAADVRISMDGRGRCMDKIGTAMLPTEKPVPVVLPMGSTSGLAPETA
jgi:putative transposase